MDTIGISTSIMTANWKLSWKIATQLKKSGTTLYIWIQCMIQLRISKSNWKHNVSTIHVYIQNIKENKITSHKREILYK